MLHHTELIACRNETQGFVCARGIFHQLGYFFNSGYCFLKDHKLHTVHSVVLSGLGDPLLCGQKSQRGKVCLP